MKYLLIGILSIIVPCQLVAQSLEPTNKMIKSERIILAKLDKEQGGVSVNIKGTSIGTITDEQGQFKIVIPDSVNIKQLSLIYQYTGYTNEELNLKRSKFLKEVSSEAPLPASFENRAASRDFTTSYSLSIPSFNWPPPPPSTKDVMDNQLLAGSKTLGEVNGRLVKSLNSLGYYENSYYSIPDGFALVTRLERIKENVPEPYDLPDRWDVNIKSKIRNISDYLEYLLTAKKGRFRVIVFAVTDDLITTAGKSITRDDAMAWLTNGSNTLPEIIADKKFSSTYHITVLIYEFEKKEEKKAEFISNSPFPGKQHMKAVYTFLQSEK